MNAIQAQLISLLRCSLNGERVDINSLQNVDWYKLLETASNHQVKSLVYFAIHKVHDAINIEKYIFEELKKYTLLTALYQIKHINQSVFILNKLNENKIPVIALKGLVIRELYPRPEFRTMSDADILVKKSDLITVKEIMKNLGYSEIEDTRIHTTFSKKSFHNVEVHWTIADDLTFKDHGALEKKMWDNAVKVMIGDSEILSFSSEDLLIHLCVHMREHLLSGSFGVRQIADLMLVINKRGDSINWTSVFEKAKSWGIEKFIVIILLVCKELFGVNMPEEIKMYFRHGDNKLVNILINDILSGGVYGSKDLEKAVANEFAYGVGEKQGGGILGVLRRFLRLVFLPPEKVKERYSYVKGNNLLMPIAWIHNIIISITNNKFGVINKIKVFSIGIFFSLRRYKLLKKLEL